MCFKHSHIFVYPECGTHKGDGACVDAFLSIRTVEPTRGDGICDDDIKFHKRILAIIFCEPQVCKSKRLMCFHSNRVWSNKFVSARNVQATLFRVLSISFVETQNSRTALRGFVQILLGRSGLVWLFSDFLVGSLVRTVSGSRCSSASRSSWVGAGSGGGGRLRSSSVSVCRRVV